MSAGDQERKAAPAEPGQGDLDRIATVPNLLSAIRILLIPVFVWLLLHHTKGMEMAGLLLLGGVVATDWIDGQVARRTGQVSNLGKLLDPIADRVALAAALITLVVRHAFPLWAALLILVRDGLLLIAGAVLLIRWRVRIDVRRVGKAATFGLMWGIPLVAWGSFGLWLHRAATVAGWLCFVPGVVLYYVATAFYVVDFARAIRGARARTRI